MSGNKEYFPEAGSRGAAARAALRARTPKSQELGRRATEFLAREVVPTVDMPFPIYVDSVLGGHLTDVDGNRFVDLAMGFGPHVLGHRPAPVEEAIRNQAGKGWHFGIHNALQSELAALICEASPCAEKVLFCSTGTEATMYAMRAARAFTGRSRVALFEGGYHGSHDYALAKADRSSPREEPATRFLGGGIPAEALGPTMMLLPYRDEAAYDLIRRHRDELALVMIEPVQSSNPRLDVGPFLQGLAEVCRECGVLLCFDEVITGFRLGWRGGQGHFGVTPDLATYGKAIGGGMPIGALAGRADIMGQFGGFGLGNAPVFAGGTFSGNPFAMAAGIAALGHMKAHADEIYPWLMRQGDRFAEAFNGFCQENQIAAQAMNAASIFHLHFQREPIEGGRDITGANSAAEREFYLHLLARDVLVPGIHLAFFASAHTEADVDQVIAASKEALMEVRADGLL